MSYEEQLMRVNRGPNVYLDSVIGVRVRTVAKVLLSCQIHNKPAHFNNMY